MTYGEFRISGDLSLTTRRRPLGSSKALGCDLGAILCVHGALSNTFAEPSDVWSPSRQPIINHLENSALKRKELPPTVRFPSPAIIR